MNAWLLAGLSAAVVWFSSAALAAEGPPALLTGAAFRKQLDAPTDILWKDQRGLREALEKLGEAKQIAIVLDRRVDPDQPVEFSSSDLSLEQALRQLASRLKLGVAVFDSTVYLGPESVTYRLGTVAAIEHDRAGQAPAERRAKLRAAAALDAPALSSPRELLEAWAVQCGVTLYQAEKVPHDLWPALRLPAQSAATRATLLLAGFDLAIEFAPDGSAARVIAMPEKPVLTRTYPGGGNPAHRAEQIARQFPQADVKTEAGKLVISGSLEDHDYIARLLRGETIRRTQVGPGEKRYTLSVENQPLGAVLRALAAQVKMQVEFDEAVGDKLEQRVSFSVKDATLEDLFKQILAPQGLDFLFVENKILVRKAK